MAGKRSNYRPNPNQLPLFTPESVWKPKPPSEWPDFRANAKIIGVDTETYDPNLEDLGPGFVRNDAKLLGVSLASNDGQKLYLPLYHSEDNVEDPVQALAYIKHQLGGEQVKCGANLLYDMESLWSVGIDLKGDLGDIQIAEPILDEDKISGYSLEVLAKEYLGIGKTETLLDEAGVVYGGNPKKLMHIIPARYIGQYAEDDALLPIKIFEQQLIKMRDDQVWDIFQLERRLQRTLFKMRLKGIRIDFDECERLTARLIDEEKVLFNQIQDLSESHRMINPASSDEVGDILARQNYAVPMTAAGNYSIKNEWLESLDGELPHAIKEWRKTTKMRKDFIEKLMNDSYKGRIYTSWHQLREDKGDGTEGARGTRSGRIASSKYNMTQVPSRDPKWGKMIRRLFIADEGKRWVKADYSQQEPRILLHFAYVLKFAGAAAARQRYIDDPSTDYHQLVADLVLERSGKDIGRRNAKDINLGSAYGMGIYKLASKLGVDLDTAKIILEAYHAGVPYVRELERLCTKTADQRGWIYTILKRKRRFPLWEPDESLKDKAYVKPIRDKEEATRQWTNVRRAFAHKALNALVQGSAADQIKKALILLDDAGLCPQVQVYDEINGSYATVEEALAVQRIMETAIPEFTIPFLAEPDIGPSWGDAKGLVL